MTDASAGPLRLVTVALLASLGACAAAPSPETARSQADLVIGSYPFTESRVLAHVYAAALEEAGWDVDLEADVSSRELMIPALEQGAIDLVPEYEGTLNVFLTGVPPVGGAVSDIEHGLTDRDLVALHRAPAENKNEFVVTRETSERLGLHEISDLKGLSERLVLGGPTECPGRQLCLLGLESLYGIQFGTFRALDTGGPLTLAALRGGEIDVGVLFTTDPALLDPDLIVLTDDFSLQPREHITPVMSSESLAQLDPAIRSVIDAVSARLFTGALRRLNRQVEIEGRDPAVVAVEWLLESD